MSRLGFILNNCVRLGMGQWIIHTLLNKFKWTISFKESIHLLPTGQDLLLNKLRNSSIVVQKMEPIRLYQKILLHG